ncbi:SPFH domain-containing protein [Sulfurovum sp. XGS-02]|uniref:prohibitin family protein n=1 Tax=Sulfurovum sp. XGS-02 TaxID=2925411 RepID=UPI002053872B|nr:prohibitin family protein [Sulfurovum sp. XGS-02]UPT77777.1 SPFH domain-containing protein [Sulfurovum sp. XGS-02]
MPADMNDYFKKKKPSNSSMNNSSSGGGGGRNFENPLSNMGKGAPWMFIIVALGFALFVLKPFTIINSGEVGIKINTGKFEEKPLNAGLHFFIPVLQKIIPVNTRIRMITYSDVRTGELGDAYRNLEGGLKRNPAITVLDKRGLTVNIDIAVQYRLRAETAPATIERWGASWEEKIINSKVREVVRDVVGRYTAEQLPEMRNEIAAAIETKVKESVDSLDDKPVVLSSVELRTINLPTKIKDQIERVQIAKQEVTIAEQQKEKAKQEAQRKAEIARGEAERNRIEAQGEADKIRIEAEEQSKANKLISESLSPQLIQLEQIKTQAKFNEALKVNNDAQIFLTPGGAVPNIWIDAKGKKQQTVSAQQ